MTFVKRKRKKDAANEMPIGQRPMPDRYAWGEGDLIIDNSGMTGKTFAETDTTADLPTKVRYVKNGRGARWWPTAKSCNQIHLGWGDVPDEFLRPLDLPKIKSAIQSSYGTKTGGDPGFQCSLFRAGAA